MQEVLITIISIAGTISTILFAYLAFKRNDKSDAMLQAKSEGILLSDIGYIKSSLNRMELKLDNVESNHNDLLKRVIKLEETYNSLSQRINEYIHNDK